MSSLTQQTHKFKHINRKRTTERLFILFVVAVIHLSCSQPVPDFDVLKSSVRTILQIESAEFIYRDIIYQGTEEKFLGLFQTADTRLLFAVDFRVRAGIDAQKGLEILPINGLSPDQEPAILIRMPPPEILSIDADEASIQQFFVYEYGFLQDKRIQWLDVQDEIALAKNRIRADSLKRGILNKAWENSSGIISNFFTLAGYKTVRIESLSMPDPSQSPTPSSEDDPGGIL